MRKERKRITAVPILIVLAVLLFGAILFMEEPELIPLAAREQVFAEGGSGAAFLPGDPEKKLAAFANQNGLSTDDWPEELKALFYKAPETEEFVLNYPFLKGTEQDIDLSEYENCTQLPQLFQWDARWGYTEYSGNIMGITGCGPTCLSMVSIYLLQDTKFTPRYIADFSEEKGYYTDGLGSNWTLISQGGRELGLDVKELPLVWGYVQDNLEAGNPIICVLGPGDFTDSGHFVVMSEVVDGKVKILDPNSAERSEMLWDFAQIESQIENLWVCKLP